MVGVSSPSGNNIEAPSDDRLARFDADLARLGAGRPTPGRDRILAALGGLVVIAGVVLAFVGLNITRSAANELEQGDGLAQLLVALVLVVAGSILWLRYSIGRYLRYWMLRAIHENRSGGAGSAIHRSSGGSETHHEA